MTMPETTQSDLVERLEAMAEQDRAYGYHARAEMLSDAAFGIKSYRESAERLQKIESQMDGGRFDEWPTATFAGQLRMQSRDNLDPEFGQFMAATATHMGILSGQFDAQREIAERAKEDAARLRAHCEAMEKALGLYTCHPCPVCSGDCGSANPPVLNCPTQAALNAFGGWDAYRKESGA